MLNVSFNIKHVTSGMLFPDNLLASTEKKVKNRKSDTQNLG